jgi:hypothetical protein
MHALYSVHENSVLYMIAVFNHSCYQETRDWMLTRTQN